MTDATPETAAEPPKPRLSSTLLLVRDAPDLQVLMVKRHYEIDFASGALVFPGGKAAPGDSQEGWADHCDGNHDAGERAARIAAVREVFEESGVLVARRTGEAGPDAPLVGQDVVEALDPMRGPVDRGEADFLSLMREHGLVLALDRLVHYAHWITPTMMPKRFDTHFYLAAMPEGQVATQDGRETTEAVWLAPAKAVEMEAAGEATIIFPTRMNLKRLALETSVGGAMARFANDPVITVLPEVTKDEAGNPCLRIPEVEGYGQIFEPLGNVANVMKPKG